MPAAKRYVRLSITVSEGTRDYLKRMAQKRYATTGEVVDAMAYWYSIWEPKEKMRMVAQAFENGLGENEDAKS